MERTDELLYELIKTADDKGKISTFYDLLMIVTLEELARLSEYTVKDIINWAKNPGTMPENDAHKFASYIELSIFAVEEIFGLKKHPVYSEFEQYRNLIENSPYGKLSELVDLAEEVKEAFDGAIGVTITFQK